MRRALVSLAVLLLSEVGAAAVTAEATSQAAGVPSSPSAIPDSLRPGTPLRITLLAAPKPGRVAGIYRSRTVEKLELEPLVSHGEKQLLVVPVGDMTRLEVSRKRVPHTIRGLLIGSLLGVAAVGATLYASRNNEAPPPPSALLVIPTGAAIGALVGGAFVSYHWQTVWERPPRAREKGG